MASTTSRNLGDQLKARLRVQAVDHGHSMDDEVREILRSALSTERQRNGGSLIASIRTRIESFSGVELELPSREAIIGRVGFGA